MVGEVALPQGYDGLRIVIKSVSFDSLGKKRLKKFRSCELVLEFYAKFYRRLIGIGNHF